jgi:NAD+ synthase
MIDISPMVDAYFGRIGEAGALGDEGLDASPIRRGNLMARTRMSVLYDFSVTWRGLVVGTGNKTEALLGYTTMYGDNACAFNPVGDLYKSQLRQLALDLGVPRAIISKAPSADLWPGQTDEGEVGLSYATADRILHWMVDRGIGRDDLVARGFDERLVDRVRLLVAGSGFKRRVPPVAGLGAATLGLDDPLPSRLPPSDG